MEMCLIGIHSKRMSELDIGMLDNHDFAVLRLYVEITHPYLKNQAICVLLGALEAWSFAVAFWSAESLAHKEQVYELAFDSGQTAQNLRSSILGASLSFESKWLSGEKVPTHAKVARCS